MALTRLSGTGCLGTLVAILRFIERGFRVGYRTITSPALVDSLEC